MVIAVVVLLCEKPGAGATRSLRENTSGENSVMMSRAVQAGTQDNPVGESLKSQPRIPPRDPGFDPAHAKPYTVVDGTTGPDFASCIPP